MASNIDPRDLREIECGLEKEANARLKARLAALVKAGRAVVETWEDSCARADDSTGPPPFDHVGDAIEGLADAVRVALDEEVPHA